MPDFKAKMHKIRFPWVSSSDPAGGSLEHSPNSRAIRPTSKGKEAEGKAKEKGDKNRKGEGRWKGRGNSVPSALLNPTLTIGHN